MIRRPAAILALLTGLNLLNYLDRFVLSAVLSPLEDELHLAKSVAGSLATMFMLGYFATSPFFGLWADRANAAGGRAGGRKTLVAAGIAIWSLATIATGFCRSAGALFATRAFVGVGEASYATIAPTIIDDLAPPSQRARWLAIFYSAIPIGSALGYIVGGVALSRTHRWQSAFFVAGGPGVLLAALCLFVHEPGRPVRSVPPSRGTSDDAPLPMRASTIASTVRTLLARRLYRKTVLGLCAYTFAIGGFAYWAPTYVHVRYQMEAGRASAVFGLLTVVGGALGTLAGGWLGDWATRGRTSDEEVVRGNLFLCSLSAAIGAPLALAGILAPSANAFFLGALPCEIALFLLNGPVNVATLRSVPAELRASGMAFSIFLIHLLGDLWSPPILGALADGVPMQWAMLLCPATFALAALVWRGRTRAGTGPQAKSPLPAG